MYLLKQLIMPTKWIQVYNLQSHLFILLQMSGRRNDIVPLFQSVGILHVLFLKFPMWHLILAVINSVDYMNLFVFLVGSLDQHIYTFMDIWTRFESGVVFGYRRPPKNIETS